MSGARFANTIRRDCVTLRRFTLIRAKERIFGERENNEKAPTRVSGTHCTRRRAYVSNKRFF